IVIAVRKVFDDAGPATDLDLTREAARRGLNKIVAAVIELFELEKTSEEARKLNESLTDRPGNPVGVGGLFGGLLGRRSPAAGTSTVPETEVRCFTELDWTTLRTQVQAAARPLPEVRASTLTDWLRITETKAQRIPDTKLLCLAAAQFEELRKR